MRMPRSILPVCCLALLAAGCGETNRPTTPDEAEQATLTQVGELCRNYQAMKQKPPQKLADFQLVRSIGGNGFEALNSGRIVLLYNAKLPDLDEDPGHSESSEVLAYMKDVPQSGGYVLVLNRTVKKMTAEEFKAAPRPAGAKEGSAEPAKTK
jgi:hypothetical protein